MQYCEEWQWQKHVLYVVILQVLENMFFQPPLVVVELTQESIVPDTTIAIQASLVRLPINSTLSMLTWAPDPITLKILKQHTPYIS
ncbi:hypothetical protein DH20_22345 [Pantoea agglomerans]|nr:hypothetical protein [Pantoea agglomerans]